MSEIVIISLIIAGMVELIKYNEGIDFLLNFITKRIKSKKGATLAGISPFRIMKYLYYPYLMGISALIVILFIPNIKRN